MAMLATAFKGMWLKFGQLILLMVVTFAARGFGFYLIGKAEQQEYELPELPPGPPMPRKLIVISWLLVSASLIPYVGYLSVIALVVCAIILCFYKSPQAKKHGIILLSLIVFGLIALCLLGWFFADWFPTKM
jgi:hypothetical protein